MTLRLSLAAVSLLLLVPCLVAAKPPTAQITFTGPQLEMPLNVTDPDVISAHVWMGNFADWNSGPVIAPTDELQPYLLHFWVRLNPEDIQLKYVLEYRWLGDEDRALICLPGRQSVWYSTNVYSIRRRGQDGNCYYAEADWGRAVQTALNAATQAH